MNFIAVKCNVCGKTVITQSHSDSTDMIQVDTSLLYMGDCQEKESARPRLDLKHWGNEPSHHYCPRCLLNKIRRWVEILEKRPPSDIPPENIFYPEIRRLNNDSGN